VLLELASISLAQVYCKREEESVWYMSFLSGLLSLHCPHLQDLLLEEILGATPDTTLATVLESLDGRQEIARECFARLSWQQCGQVIDGANIQGRVGFVGLAEVDRDHRVVKSRVDRVHWDRVVWVGGIARDVDNDREGTLTVQHFLGKERWDGLVQVDAVDKDGGLENAWEGSSSLGLLDIPLDDLVLGNADSTGEIDGTSSAATQCSHYHDFGDLALVRLDY